MAHSHRTPDQPDEPSGSQVIDPKAGKPLQYADLRSEFEKESRQSARDPQAERAFILNKIEMVRSDPHLSDDEKKRVIADLERGLPSL